MSFAAAYAAKKHMKKMAKGGAVEDDGASMPVSTDGMNEKCAPHGKMGCGMCHGGAMAKGGEVGSGFSDDMVDRIMKHRYAKGGEVSADEEPNDFDVMDKEEVPDFHETGANSGDELGNEHEDEDERDVVSRIMKSRYKKDKMPRPA